VGCSWRGGRRRQNDKLIRKRRKKKNVKEIDSKGKEEKGGGARDALVPAKLDPIRITKKKLQVHHKVVTEGKALGSIQYSAGREGGDRETGVTTSPTEYLRGGS